MRTAFYISYFYSLLFLIEDRATESSSVISDENSNSNAYFLRNTNELYYMSTDLNASNSLNDYYTMRNNSHESSKRRNLVFQQRHIYIYMYTRSI